MSLVQAYIYEKFILVAGEQRATLGNGQVIENFVKVKKLNDSVIIGMTGTIEGNAKLFSDFINCGFSLKCDWFSLNYNEVNKIVNDSYYKNNEYLQEHKVHSLVCGWDGEKFTGCSYFTKCKKESMNRPRELTPEYDGHVVVLNCGLDEHYDKACEMKEKYNPSNIGHFKNIFKDVIDNGVKFDNTINKNITFEQIRKVDMIRN